MCFIVHGENFGSNRFVLEQEEYAIRNELAQEMHVL